ncbi:MAG: type III-B CRISPR module RAMP protein Cmr6, partial [Bacteroidetes bacterium]|nr:type III-B CRISPR module RAMP protein Cmr6 [Bacteroidota bacterium]
TVYPGMLIGAGYSHYAIKSEGEDSDYQLGFFFDHTLGIPIIPGSSVKGVLKNVFPMPGKDRTAKLDYVYDLVRKENDKVSKEYLLENWEEIFFKNDNVFFHAFPVKREKDNKSKDEYDEAKKQFQVVAAKLKYKISQRILVEDAITPHPKDIFKEPIPLKFIKVPAEVTFEFQFRINDYNRDSIHLIPEKIGNVFKKILIEFGICAKRNVGYGHFKE